MKDNLLHTSYSESDSIMLANTYTLYFQKSMYIFNCGIILLLLKSQVCPIGFHCTVNYSLQKYSPCFCCFYKLRNESSLLSSVNADVNKNYIIFALNKTTMKSSCIILKNNRNYKKKLKCQTDILE